MNTDEKITTICFFTYFNNIYLRTDVIDNKGKILYH